MLQPNLKREMLRGKGMERYFIYYFILFTFLFIIYDFTYHIAYHILRMSHHMSDVTYVSYFLVARGLEMCFLGVIRADTSCRSQAGAIPKLKSRI